MKPITPIWEFESYDETKYPDDGVFKTKSFAGDVSPEFWIDIMDYIVKYQKTIPNNTSNQTSTDHDSDGDGGKDKAPSFQDILFPPGLTKYISRGYKLKSKVFTDSTGFKWELSVFPSGCDENNQSLSIFLKVYDDDGDPFAMKTKDFGTYRGVSAK